METSILYGNSRLCLTVIAFLSIILFLTVEKTKTPRKPSSYAGCEVFCSCFKVWYFIFFLYFFSELFSFGFL